MKSVFADSFFYFSLINPKDPCHLLARKFSLEFRGRVITTAAVLTEVADGCAIQRWRKIFVKLLDQIEADRNTKVIGPSYELYKQGLELYMKRPDKEWSLTDCVSFVVMERRGLSDALTGDLHFRQAGFNILF